MPNEFSITCNRLMTNLQEQSSKHPLPRALTAQAGKMMLAANSLFNFVAAGASRVISIMSNGKYLDGKATTLFAQAKTDFAKASASGLVGFAFFLVVLVVLYKKLIPTKTNDNSVNKTEDFSNRADFTKKITIPDQIEFINEVTIPQTVKETLNKLFEESEFISIDQLPHYIGPTNTGRILPENMTHVIEKGAFRSNPDGLVECVMPFIAIKIKTTLSTSTKTKLQEANQNETQQEKVLILTQNMESIYKAKNLNCAWKQLRYSEDCPSFFSSLFIGKNGSLLPNQDKEFKTVQRLIRGEAIEIRKIRKTYMGNIKIDSQYNARLRD